MKQERNPVWIALGIVLVVALAFWLVPRVEEELAPEPQRAWVAIEIDGEGVAEVGWRKVERGTAFTLHAVLEARDRKGGTVYYTEAPSLRIAGQDVPAESLRRWERRRPPKILWFTVEAGYGFRDIKTAEQLEKFDMTEVYRPTWPQAWAIPGELTPSWVQDPAAMYGPQGQPFGTQRFHVRIEVYGDDDALLPQARFKSAEAPAVAKDVNAFPTVTAYVPGLPRPASEIFGLPQLEPAEGAVEMLRTVADLSRDRLAFSRLTVLAETFQTRGAHPQEVQWQPLDLGTAPAWGTVVGTGDVLQVADRLVMLYEDRGDPGVLDDQDLCFDFAKGAAVRPLGQIFEGEGEVRWASLSTSSGTP